MDFLHEPEDVKLILKIFQYLHLYSLFLHIINFDNYDSNEYESTQITEDHPCYPAL